MPTAKVMTEEAIRQLPYPRVGMRLFSDHRLIRLAAAGDERAFGAIYERYHPQLYRYCQALLGNPQEAQDALQNAMVSVLRALPGERREIELKPWLYRIAHNAATDLIRKRRPTEELEAGHAAAVEDVQSSAEKRARLRELVADLGELPERQRGALVMRELGGMEFAEIASAFETSQGVVRQTVYEARLGLQQMAEGREMPCDSVRRALSDGNGRILRRRAIRSHLRACESCRDFRDGITARSADLAAISPLSAAAAAGLLQGILGGGKGGSGGAALGLLGGGAGQAVMTSAALKVGVTVLAAGAIAVPAGHAVGAIELPLTGGASTHESTSSTPSQSRTPTVRPAPSRLPSGSVASRGKAAAGVAENRGAPASERHHAGPPDGLPSQTSYGREIAASRVSEKVPERVPATPRPTGGPPSSDGGQPSAPTPTPAPPPSPPAGLPAPPAPPANPPVNRP